MIDLDTDELLGFDQVSKVADADLLQAGRLLSKLAGEVPTISETEDGTDLDPEHLLGFDKMAEASEPEAFDLRTAGRLLSKTGPEIPDRPAGDPRDADGLFSKVRERGAP